MRPNITALIYDPLFLLSNPLFIFRMGLNIITFIYDMFVQSACTGSTALVPSLALRLYPECMSPERYKPEFTLIPNVVLPTHCRLSHVSRIVRL